MKIHLNMAVAASLMIASATLASIALAQPDSPREATAFRFIPDELGGLWIIGQGPDDSDYMRLCRTSDVSNCGPWMAVGQGFPAAGAGEAEPADGTAKKRPSRQASPPKSSTD